MFSFFVFHSFSNKIRYNSLVQLTNTFTNANLGIVYEENDARFRKPAIAIQVGDFDDSWNWGIISADDLKSTDQIKCGDDVSLFNANNQMYLNVRRDEHQGRNIIFASRILNGGHSSFKIECGASNETDFRTGIKFFLQNEAVKCYMGSDFSYPHPEVPSSFLMNCTDLDQKSVWTVNKGLFLNEPEEEPEQEYDQLSHEL